MTAPNPIPLLSLLLALLTPTHTCPAQNLPLPTPVFTAGQNNYHTYRIPALHLTKQSTLLAFAEGRRNGQGDAGNIDLLLRRSTNLGRSWEPTQTIWNDDKNTCGNPCIVEDQTTGTLWLLMTWNRGDDHESEIIAGKSHDTRRIFVTSSTDDGITWTAPHEITSSVKLPNWTWYATGPGAGIQIEHGPHQGRLVIPCDHIEAETKHYYSHVIYSDDHGQTWNLGGSTPNHQVNECEVVEIANGQLLLNMRNYDRSQKTRQQATSPDGGLTWTQQRHVPQLIEPICQASIRRLAWPANQSPGILLFSNPASTSRNQMTLKASLDDGQTWPHSILIHPGPSAYSCLTPLPQNHIGLLYEAGQSNPYETILFQSIPLNRLLPNP